MKINRATYGLKGIAKYSNFTPFKLHRKIGQKISNYDSFGTCGYNNGLRYRTLHTKTLKRRIEKSLSLFLRNNSYNKDRRYKTLIFKSRRII